MNVNLSKIFCLCQQTGSERTGPQIQTMDLRLRIKTLNKASLIFDTLEI